MEQIREYTLIEDKKVKRIFNIMIFILFVSICAFGSFELLKIQIYNQHKDDLNFLHIVLKIIIILYMSIFIHELGHLVIARIYKYDLKFFCAGPFFILKDKGKLKFKIKITAFLFGGATGIDLQASVKSEEDFIKLKKEFKSFLLGGCIFNGLFAIIGTFLMLNNTTIDVGFIIVLINILSIIGCIFPLGDIEKIIILNKNSEHIFLFMQNDLSINYAVNDFYREKIVDFVNIRLMAGQYNYDVLTCMLSLIEYNIVHHKPQPEEFNRFLYWLIHNHETLKSQHKFLIRHKINSIITRIIDFRLLPEDLIEGKKVKVMRTIKEARNSAYIEFEEYRKNKNILESKRVFQEKSTYIKKKNTKISTKKHIIIDNVISIAIGLVLYIIIIFINPSINEVNSIIDILIFAVCFVIGDMIYKTIKKYIKRE
ncbi:peptidase family M50 [Clostridium pasteurianum DSM 525 = ATCC 6013]|uniref:Peptidase M50 n=1 Tax=Clostridium pasteurianum DSM 525 = ATCC 6013 TaxID=1262449 RepID=A0A0H3J0M3_CLOPA|nr:M50 family metallopeptidase [Clostridium pasteurianum]AJA47391.1 peptidase family M50 [Clostridium pasteurianum DSM 525 = ATCC 6013]AJA51379.1 peptidase family M50 [Clostridium pasteurianum DSM 525 = ATCC 6013]AOZ74719.1 hypothetical protein AQ983_06230 [Clostridium pasteurianum DSM 525 = ATCC 6013]AOZ78515.1 hypothetical protein AQ984_06220 [Clostridium pasteurianum]ELP58727.1 Peptidase family M50 [Clostridium pasteurianum DSM 525 = ATCC 6013]